MSRNTKPQVTQEGVVVGLDLSLTATGYVVLDRGEIKARGVIKSKPDGDTPLDEFYRLAKILDGIKEVLYECGEPPTLVAIEGLAFMARNTTALVQLSGLNYLVRELLAYEGIDFVMVAPSTLKKFVTGKGNSDKSVMMMTVLKEYGEEFLDDNQCDAFGLAAIACAMIGAPLKKPNAAQTEVVNLIAKQLV